MYFFKSVIYCTCLLLDNVWSMVRELRISSSKTFIISNDIHTSSSINADLNVHLVNKPFLAPGMSTNNVRAWDIVWKMNIGREAKLRG